MNRMERPAEGPARTEMRHGSPAAGRHATADSGADGQVFKALLQDFARRTTGTDRREPGPTGEAAAERPIEDGATPGGLERPADADALADVARLLFPSAAAERERPGGEQAPVSGRRGGEAADPRRGATAVPAHLPTTRVVARETHFEPILRQSGPTSHGDHGAPGVPVSAGPSARGTPAGDAAAGGRSSASVGAGGRASGNPLHAAGVPHVSDQSPSIAVATARAAPPERDALSDTGPQGAAGRPGVGEPDPVTGDVRRHAAGADASALSRRAAGGSIPGEGPGPAPPAATTAQPASTDPSTSTLPASTLQRLAGAIAAEAGALAASRSSFGQPPGVTAPAAGGPVKILVLRLQPETLGTVTVRLRLVGNALELQVRAASAETAELLERDRGVLEECLKASGYDADLSAIQTMPRDAPRSPADQAGLQASQGRQDPFLGSGSSQGNGEHRPGRDEQGDDSRASPATGIRTREVNDETRGQGDRAGGLYL